ncbi:hypothetical protein SOVF_031970 [Spinacia oleracea]|nr:hypothetical protein SOVF_031970 [Spinacia oleracea]
MEFHCNPTINHSDALSFNFPVNPFHLTRRNLLIRPPRFLVSSKKASFQDFQEYAKPRQLFPTEKLKTYVNEPPEKTLSALQLDGPNSLYKVVLRTSSMYGSDLSDQNAGILVCIIDEHGDSILERVPAIQDHFQLSEDAVTSDVLRFQRGATDEYMFWGPKLGRIQAMWTSLESGSWRLGGASLTIISVYNHQIEEPIPNGSVYSSITYNFEVEDVLLGEGSDLTMAELRPCLVTDHIGDDAVSIIIDGSSSLNVSRAEKGIITNEDSMKEYADLKYSLLLYDSMLIFTGTTITSITVDKSTALAFLTGGIGGFLYLLFLQRSVDTLPAPESIVKDKGNNFDGVFGGLKGPIVVFVTAFAIAVLATKYDKPDFIPALTPREILAGTVGFLACKVSVILAAFKPVSMGIEDND